MEDKDKVLMDDVIAEIRIGLGLVKPKDGEDWVRLEQMELPLFDRINEIYQEAAGGCYFCSDIDPNEKDFDGNLCPICKLKAKRYREYYQQMQLLADSDGAEC